MTGTTPPSQGVTEFCNCCERELNPATSRWLELNTFTGRWQDPAAKSAEDWGDDSQGSFPFGQACARRVLREQPDAHSEWAMMSADRRQAMKEQS